MEPVNGDRQVGGRNLSQFAVAQQALADGWGSRLFLLNIHSMPKELGGWASYSIGTACHEREAFIFRTSFVFSRPCWKL